MIVNVNWINNSYFRRTEVIRESCEQVGVTEKHTAFNVFAGYSPGTSILLIHTSRSSVLLVRVFDRRNDLIEFLNLRKCRSSTIAISRIRLYRPQVSIPSPLPQNPKKAKVTP